MPLISCGIGFYESYELPHPSSQTIEKLDFSETERSAYVDLRHEVSALGARRDHEHSGHGELNQISRLNPGREDISKLFGWPDLIRHELDACFERPGRKTQKLLLQLGPYHDGSEWQLWGPGGLVYFTITARDLAARRFDRAALEMQYAPE